MGNYRSTRNLEVRQMCVSVRECVFTRYGYVLSFHSDLSRMLAKFSFVLM